MTKEGVIDSLWVCPPSPNPNPTGWPTFPNTNLPTDSDRHYSSPDVQAWSVGNQMQLFVVLQVKHFFKHTHAHEDEDDDEDEDEYEDEDEDEDEDSDDDDDSVDYSLFFSKLFEDNKELRDFYEKNKEKGEFGCLVCGGVGFIKRFKDCVSLVQHTVSIYKTKKIKAHRDFGKVVCNILGWDINKLPSKHQHRNENAPAAQPNRKDETTGNHNSPPDRKDEATGNHNSPPNRKDEATGNHNSPPNRKDEATGNHNSPPNRKDEATGNQHLNENAPAAQPKGKDEATGNHNSPPTPIAKLPQEPPKEDGSGKNESEDN